MIGTAEFSFLIVLAAASALFGITWWWVGHEE